MKIQIYSGHNYWQMNESQFVREEVLAVMVSAFAIVGALQVLAW